MGSLSAQTINWGNAAPNPVTTDINFDSTGSTLDGTYTFELGVFDVGYDPDVEDPTTWFSNWTTLDTAIYNPTLSLFSDSYQITDNTYLGRQAYIFGYNQTTPVDETTEWVLITDDDGLNNDDWVIPDHQDQSALTLEWRVTNATRPVFGGLEDVDGPGERTVDPGTFELQTNTFAPPVPEPGAFAFFGFASLLGLRRRRGRN